MSVSRQFGNVVELTNRINNSPIQWLHWTAVVSSAVSLSPTTLCSRTETEKKHISHPQSIMIMFLITQIRKHVYRIKHTRSVLHACTVLSLGDLGWPRADVSILNQLAPLRPKDYEVQNSLTSGPYDSGETRLFSRMTVTYSRAVWSMFWTIIISILIFITSSRQLRKLDTWNVVIGRMANNFLQLMLWISVIIFDCIQRLRMSSSIDWYLHMRDDLIGFVETISRSGAPPGLKIW